MLHGDLQDPGVFRVGDSDHPLQFLIIHLKVQIVDDLLQYRTAGGHDAVVVGQLGSDLQVRQRRERRLLGQHQQHGRRGVDRRHHISGIRARDHSSQDAGQQDDQNPVPQGIEDLFQIDFNSVVIIGIIHNSFSPNVYSRIPAPSPDCPGRVPGYNRRPDAFPSMTWPALLRADGAFCHACP